MFHSRDVTSDYKRVSNLRRDIFDILAGTVDHHLLNDVVDRVWRQPGSFQGTDKGRASVPQLYVLSIVIHVSDISKSKDRLAPVGLAASHSSNRASWGYSRLGRISDPIVTYSLDYLIPITGRTAPLLPPCPWGQWHRWNPAQVARVIHAAGDSREWTSLPGKFDTGQHSMIADELYQVTSKFLGLLAAIANF